MDLNEFNALTTASNQNKRQQQNLGDTAMHREIGKLRLASLEVVEAVICDIDLFEHLIESLRSPPNNARKSDRSTMA